MHRESLPRLDEEQRPAASASSCVPDKTGLCTEDASQRITLWLEQTLAAQVLAFRRLTDALQAAVDALLSTQDSQRLQEVRGTLLATVVEELAHWQSETIDAWCALQWDLSHRTALSATAATSQSAASDWWPCPSPAMEAQSDQDAKVSASADDAIKTWEPVWLPWLHGTDASLRA